MEVVLSVLVGGMVAGAVFLMLNRNLVKFLLGLILISNAANLIIFASGRLTRAEPPLVAAGAYTTTGVVANALPQALILTAIVIGFGLLSFALVLAYRTYQETGTVDVDAMNYAEPRPLGLPSEASERADEPPAPPPPELKPPHGRVEERV